MAENQPYKGGLDLLGLGKLAKAIPPEVYRQGTKSVVKTFDSLVAPLTQATDGVGRLIRQTFDNWVDERKAIGTVMIQHAVIRAQERAEKQGKTLRPPNHPKTFLRTLEEGSLETDSVVREMWVNLLASQLVDRNSHPRFVSILSELGPEEARLLLTLKPLDKDPRLTHFLGGGNAHLGGKSDWTADLDQPGQPWNLSVTILCQQSLANIAPQVKQEGKSKHPLFLFLTLFGKDFMAVVAPPSEGNV